MKKIHDQNDDLKDYPILQSLRRHTNPSVPDAYFDQLTDKIFQKIQIKEKNQIKLIERNRWIGFVALVSLASAAAVLMLVMLKTPEIEVLNEQKMFSQISPEELLRGIELRDMDIETISSTLGNESMASADPIFERSLLDSLAGEEQLDFLRDIDPSEIYDL